MDPNAAWDAICRFAALVIETDVDPESSEELRLLVLSEAIDVAQSIEALKEWLAKGGFPPAAFVPTKTEEKGVFTLRINLGDAFMGLGSADVRNILYRLSHQVVPEGEHGRDRETEEVIRYPEHRVVGTWRFSPPNE